MGLGAFFGAAPATHRTPLFRFSLMVVRAATPGSPTRATTTWRALRNETLLSLPPTSPLQVLIDRHLHHAGIVQRGPLTNSLDMQLAMVETGEGIAVIPSYGLPACRNREVVMGRLVNPIVTLDFSQLRAKGKRLPPGTEEFSSFLQEHIARWAGRAGVL
jgi:LysR family transcriptional regulator, carnitine catabolism transcriptional activator